jgi:3-oxoacyl-[acyl-carrier-protein] synthase-3
VGLSLSPTEPLPALKITAAVSLADSPGFFAPLGNAEILGLSRQGGRCGFRDEATIRRLTGIESRRLLMPNVTPLQLVHGLNRYLGERTGRLLSSCDAVLLCHSHANPDVTEHLAAEVAADKTSGVRELHVANLGCSGFVQLLCDTAELFREHPAMHRLALLNVETPETWHCSADRVFCGIVGAGATAVLVERDCLGSSATANLVASDSTPGWRLRGAGRANLPVSSTAADGPLFFAETTDCFTFHGEPIRRCVMRMQAEAVFVGGIELMLLALRQALQLHPPRPDQAVIVLPHQPSAKLLRAFKVAARHEFPICRILENLEHHGNSISCTIPQQLSELADVCHRNSFPSPTGEELLIAVTAGICMPRKHDQMACGYAVLTPC